MIIIGLDVAQKTGWAVYNTERSISAIQAGVLKAEGDEFEDRSATLGRQFGLLLKQVGRPDLIAIETPLRTLPQGKRTTKMLGENETIVTSGGGVNAMISSNQLVGAIAALCGWKDLRRVCIPSATWRKAFLGFARHPGWERKDWKRAVREQCAREKIVVTNDDMADAVGIAIAAKNTPEFKQIAYELSRRAA
jgi:Holliday junction resolvasome RuvABC endonuclease subunit